MVPAALRTQGVGSVLPPPGFCGCVGFKPSVGRINRGGSYDYFSQSCTGVLAASLEDAWLVAVSIAARGGGDPRFPGLAGPCRTSAAATSHAGCAADAPEVRAAFGGGGGAARCSRHRARRP